jgi:hypothetical protein
LEEQELMEKENAPAMMIMEERTYNFILGDLL